MVFANLLVKQQRVLTLLLLEFGFGVTGIFSTVVNGVS